MAWGFPLLFLAWPVVEIAVLIEVAHWLGWPGAILGIILSGLIGFALLRRQGLATAQLAQIRMRQGEMPMASLFDGACLALAGGLLLLPGFVTDVVALFLLMPPVRRLLRKGLLKYMPPSPGFHRESSSTVIEGEWVVVEEKDDKPAPPSNRLS
jgi:UPF0716 protein FxsA